MTMRREYSAIGVACMVVILTWAWKLLNWVWIKPRKLEKLLRKQGLSGPSYRFLHGDLKDMSRMRGEAMQRPIAFINDDDYISRAVPFLDQHVKTYGKISFSWIGPSPEIHITEPKLIREVFTKINDFKKPYMNPHLQQFAPGLITCEGEEWVVHRKLINPAFHLEKLKLMIPAITASIIETMNEWEKMVLEAGSSEIDVFPYFKSMTSDAIARAAFGSSYKEGATIFELLKEQTQVAVHMFATVYVPGWSYIPTKNNKKMKYLKARIQDLLKGIIDKRKKAMEAGQPVQDDFLSVVMESSLVATRNRCASDMNQRPGLSFKELMDECKLFYFAGQEGTSLLLTWTIILLGKHLDWQMRARQEVLATFGKNEPNYDGLSRLKIVTMILNEVLRLYPSLATIPKQVFDHDATLGNLIVPAGTRVGLDVIYTHYDPELWGDDAKQFKPERFSEGILKASKGNVAYFPFGAGPRICLGQNFTMVETKMALSMILQRFSFELSPSYAHAPVVFFTIQPQHGAQIILRRL